VREFADRPIAEDDLGRMVSAGRRAGSSKNLQRWVFILVRNRESLRKLANAGPFASHVAGAVAAIALVTPDPRAEGAPLSIVWDLGRVAQNMMLAAWELGIGSCPATVHEHTYVRELLGIPDDHHCEYVLSFGHPADPAVLHAPNRSGGRARLEEVFREEGW
jgi:nitroreductase